MPNCVLFWECESLVYTDSWKTQHLDDSQFSRVNKHLERDKYFSQTVSEMEAQIFKNKYMKREEGTKRKGKETLLNFSFQMS